MNVQPQYLIAPVIIISSIVTCYILARLNFIPHLSSGKSRYSHIDSVRGLAALFVVCAHSGRITFTGIKNDSLFKSDVFYNQTLGAIGVQIFLCITGFLFIEKLINSKLEWSAFFIGRVKRLAPLYLFVMLAVFISMVAESGFDINKELILPTIKIFSFGFYGTQYTYKGTSLSHTISVLWTLPFEWKFYLSLPFVAVFLGDKKLFIIAVVACLMWGASFLAFDDAVYVYFFSGGIAAVIKKRFSGEFSIIFMALFFGLVIANILSVFVKFPQYGYERFLLTSLLFITMIMCSSHIFSSKPLEYLGEISYSIYLCHLLLFYLFGKAISSFANFGESSISMSLIILSIYCVLMCIISSITFKYIEYPFIKKKSLQPK